jgi:hypothetical protein
MVTPPLKVSASLVGDELVDGALSAGCPATAATLQETQALAGRPFESVSPQLAWRGSERRQAEKSAQALSLRHRSVSWPVGQGGAGCRIPAWDRPRFLDSLRVNVRNGYLEVRIQWSPKSLPCTEYIKAHHSNKF